MKNTKEVALLKVRYGRESELPEALHQGEIGLAWDTNRVFVGNKANTDLKNRIEFPYKNLELLTEYSPMDEHLKYSYLNNIDSQEKFPIVIVSTNEPVINYNCELNIQTYTDTGDISFLSGDNINAIVAKIDGANIEGIRAYKTEENKLCIVAYDSKLILTGNSAISQLYLTDMENTDSESLPERLMRNKLDDFVTSADFGIDATETDNSDNLIKALIELYNKNTTDEQYFRTFKILAGTYKIGKNQSLPLLSNMHLKGDGIDKTIIKADSSFSATNFIVSTNDKLYQENGMSAHDTLIEDMTIDVSAIANLVGKLLLLNNCSNITFRNVKFVGSVNTSFATISNSSNIIFENCTIYNFFKGIEGTTDTRIFLRNNIFDTIQDYVVVFANTIGLTMNSNTMHDCALVAGKIIDISNGCSYSSIIQTVFDSDVVENYGKLFNRANDDYTNYIDTLDASTNERKLLKFKFLQPQWEYIDYLTNSDGKTAVVIDNSQYATDSTDYPLTNNPLKILTTDNLTLENMGNDDLIIKSSQASDVVIGDFDPIVGDKGEIQIKKDIQLNDNKITNSEGTEDIVIETAPNKIIKVGDNKVNQDYEQRILGVDDAIPNVAYVNRAATTTIQNVITTDSSAQETENGIKLCFFDPTYYGENITLSNISINVRKPLFNIFKYMNTTDAIPYTTGKKYYVGDVVLENGATAKYGVVVEEHIATSTSFLSDKVVEIASALTDIAYADIVAINSSSPEVKYYLTRDISREDVNKNYSVADVSLRNNRDYYPLNISKVIGAPVDEVEDMERYYQYDNNIPQPVTSKLDLHDDNLFYRWSDEGYNYSFDMDRAYIDIKYNSPVFDTINFSNYEFYLQFFDRNGNRLNVLPLSDNTTTGTTYTKINPLGKIICNIEFIRGF